MIKVLIVDDHALVRMGIRRLLEDTHDISVMGEAQNGEEALAMVKSHRPDVILLDMKMPGIDGWEVIRRLKNSSAKSKIIAVSALSAEPFPTRVLQLGAMGYLSKESSIEEMTGAIRKVYQGERYLSAQLAQQLAIKSLDPVSETPFEQLSEREMQVMLMITSGLPVPEISKRLFLSTKTINCYRYRMFAKLNVKNDVELTHLAIKHSIIERPDEANE
ncbi:MAG TPA: two-component system response regulator UvrY [Legionellales bacterium]|nr:two-component system response regulator UvrY [Legionellales bacterium]